MAGVSKTELDVVLQAAKSIGFRTAATKLSSFCSSVLNRNALQILTDTEIAEIAATLTRYRGDELFEKGNVPGFTISNDLNRNILISGLGGFLSHHNVNSRTIDRIQHHQDIRDSLMKLNSGHYLEAVAAAILDERMEAGAATTGSGDQGIDALGWSILFKLNEAFLERDNRTSFAPDAKVFAFASSKKSETSGAKLKLISPAMIRELIGGWVIQRSPVGAWADQGVKMLSPVQMIFVTTYRLSTKARSDCKRLGVQVWGLPELVYLVAENAPDSVFDASNGFIFSEREFHLWCDKYESSRLASS
ncbi:hypothetical protein [Rhodopirellula halodulae]|uniref:hypothetical protein n=1 Tax=Rhodopirellula halodulae TaxID=2894198 RepID=UPI001E36BC63|nr:hypothetical protein [Rhodopirellula sp. JC737]MCC9654584.1 hypothetical protein [Rhodopirellula sp. JC737]